MTFEPITLSGQHVRLEPLNKRHLSELKAAIEDGQLWRLMVTNVPHPDQLESFLHKAQQDQKNGSAMVFATIDQSSNQVVGSTRYLNTDWSHARTEIGFTFIAKSKQRTAINTAAKLLLLQHAFESLPFNRVAFLTDHLNLPSRAAIARLGAKQEGTLRNHMVMPDGRVRDTVVFSIAKHEWPGIKLWLQEKLNR